MKSALFLLLIVVAASHQRFLQTTTPPDFCNTEVCAANKCTVLASGARSCDECVIGVRTRAEGTEEVFKCVQDEPCLNFYDKNDMLFGGCNSCKDGYGKDQGVEVHGKIHYGCLTLITPIDGCLNYKTPSKCALCQKDYFLQGTELCNRLEQAERIINCDLHKWDNNLLVCMKCAQGYTLNILNLLTCEATPAEKEGCSSTVAGRCISCDKAAGYEADVFSATDGAKCKKIVAGSSALLRAMLLAITMLLVF